MSLLAPLFLLGLLAAVLPWWLHRLSASDPPRHDFGSSRFLEASPSTSSKKRRTRYLLLLALRTLFLALLCLLFAQPVLERLNITGAASVRHVLLLDTSLSQNLEGRWQRSINIANDVLDSAAGSDEAVVISASDKFVQAETDRSIESARAQLGTIDLGNSRLDYGRIASAVSSIVTDSDLDVHLHIISDAQASALPERFASLAVDKIQQMKVYSSAASEDANVSVTGKLEHAANGIAEIVAIVNNYGDDTTRTLQVRANDQVLATTSINLAANSNKVHRFDKLDVSSAGKQLEISISPDDQLAADDTWQLPLPGSDRTQITVVVANTEASLSATYLTAAIESDPRFSTRRIEADRFTANDGGTLVMVPDASALSDRASNRLRQYINDGGNVFMAVGQRPHSAGTISLIGMQSPSASTRPDVNQTTGAIGNEVGFIDATHQSTDDLVNNWRAISVLRHLPLQKKLTDRRIIDLTNGDPLLLEKRMGSGKLLLLATALNTAWTNLTVESVFVAFVLQSIDYLAGDTTGVSYRSTGEAISIAPGSQLLDPNGEPMRDLSKISERATITLNEPGIYTVRNSAGARPVAVNSDVRESDITIIDDTTLQNWQEMATNPAANNRNSQTSTSNRRGFWIWLLPLLLVIALLESLYSHKHLWIRREA